MSCRENLGSMEWNVLLIPPRLNQGRDGARRRGGHGSSFWAGLFLDGTGSSGLGRCLKLTLFLVGLPTLPPGMWMEDSLHLSSSVSAFLELYAIPTLSLLEFRYSSRSSWTRFQAVPGLLQASRVWSMGKNVYGLCTVELWVHRLLLPRPSLAHTAQHT